MEEGQFNKPKTKKEHFILAEEAVLIWWLLRLSATFQHCHLEVIFAFALPLQSIRMVKDIFGLAAC